MPAKRVLVAGKWPGVIGAVPNELLDLNDAVKAARLALAAVKRNVWSLIYAIRLAGHGLTQVERRSAGTRLRRVRDDEAA